MTFEVQIRQRLKEEGQIFKRIQTVRLTGLDNAVRGDAGVGSFRGVTGF